jgi:hypothetical protein
MNINLIKQNSLGTLKLYCPNLFYYISDKDFLLFIDKAIRHTYPKGGTDKNNFIVTFFKLVNEHKLNDSNEIRNEFAYFNFLLGKSIQIGINQTKFRDLIISTLYNFELNNFLNAIGEIAALLDISNGYKFINYEVPLPNGKNVDFQLESASTKININVDVSNIYHDTDRYENEKNFETFIRKRLHDKYTAKTNDLPETEKNKVYIFPIIHGLTIKIIQSNSEFLIDINKSSTQYANSFQSFSPRVFANMGGLYYGLFSIPEFIKLGPKS